MRKSSAAAAVASMAIVLSMLLAAPAAAAKGDRVVGAIGKTVVNGQEVIVEVLVLVRAGRSERAAVDEALAQQGAKRVPVESEYSYTGLVWNPPAVTQNYNPSGQPVSAASALQNTHQTWNGAAGSSLRFSYGGTTSRCPSLVRECSGPQFRDGFQDVGWARLGGTTLGVTWSTTNPPEADMAINTRFAWSLGCSNVSGKYDLQTVLLHENGHVAGLGHSNVQAAVMYASYQGARCALHSDDINGIANLY